MKVEIIPYDTLDHYKGPSQHRSYLNSEGTRTSPKFINIYIFIRGPSVILIKAGKSL